MRKYAVTQGYTVRVLQEQALGGELFGKFRKAVWKKAHCAVVVMTQDDRMGPSNVYRARQNVVFELGYCFGAFDSLDPRSRYKAEHAVIVVEEEGVERFANIKGLVTIQFAPGRLNAVKPEIEGALRKAYGKARRFYGF